MNTVAVGMDTVDVIGTEKLGFPSVRAEVDFKAPLRFGDIADIEVTVERIGKKSVACVYRLTRLSTGEVCALGKVTVASVSMTDFKAIEIPAKYRKLFESV